jgi:hypothetical protein
VRSFPVRAEDALFLYAQTENCPQQVGAVVLLEGGSVDLDGLRSLVAAHMGPRGIRPLWLALACGVDFGVTAFLLNQNAFQAGTLIAPVLAIITTMDPLISIVIGHWIFGEHIAGSPLNIAAELLSLLVMITGIVALAHRAPHVERQLTQPRHVAQHQ